MQRRATKLIPGLSDLSYEDRLRRLKLPSLSYRRSRGDMIEVYKIMSGKYDPEMSNIFQHQEQENRNTRGHKYKLFKPRCRLNIRKNSFCIRVVNMWNSLSENVVTAKTLLTFERRLDRYWENLDLLYDNDGSFRRRKRSSYDKSESPGISFVALLCIFSIMSMCFLRYGFQTGFAYSR